MNPVIFRLYGDNSKALLLEHLLRLSSEDRYFRFMTMTSIANVNPPPPPQVKPAPPPPPPPAAPPKKDG